MWPIPGANAFFVSTWELVTEATVRVDDFSNHFRHTLFSADDGTLGVLDNGERGAPDVFAGADPPDHTLHRKVFFPELMQQKMAALEGTVTALADDLLDELLVGNRCDAAVGLANPLPLRVITEQVIGFRDVDVAQAQRWVFTGSRFMGGLVRMDDMGALGAQAAGLLPRAMCSARPPRACMTASSRATPPRSRSWSSSGRAVRRPRA